VGRKQDEMNEAIIKRVGNVYMGFPDSIAARKFCADAGFSKTEEPGYSIIGSEGGIAIYNTSVIVEYWMGNDSGDVALVHLSRDHGNLVWDVVLPVVVSL